MTTAKPIPVANSGNYYNGIYFPETDGQPLPDGFEQEPLFLQVVPALRSYLMRHYQVIVSGNTFIYYDETNPRRSVSPDCYVAFGVSDDAVPPYNSYFTWHVGKVPDFVLEIASEGTADRDLNEKPGIYAAMGVGEYWRYDATPDSKYYGEPLVGTRLVDGEYQRLLVEPDGPGMLRGHSPALGLDICWDDGRLRFYDPARNIWLPDYEELLAARDAAESRAAEAEAQLAELQAELRRLRSEG